MPRPLKFRLRTLFVLTGLASGLCLALIHLSAAPADEASPGCSPWLVGLYLLFWLAWFCGQE